MRTLRLGTALTMLLATGACAQVAGGSPAGSGSDPGREVTSTALPPPQPGPSVSGAPREPGPNETRPDSRAVDLRPAVWDRIAPATGNQVRVHFTTTGRPECAALGRVDIAEAADAVTITLLVGRLPGADCDGAVAQLAAPMVTTVSLKAPLGHRSIRDGSRN